MVAYRHRLITSGHPCILHLEPGKSMLESSLAVLTANNIRLLLNKLYRSHVCSVNNKVVNAFTSRSMPLRRPKSKQVFCIDFYHFLILSSFKVYAYEYISVSVLKHYFDAGIGIVCYVHSLIGLAGNTITKKGVDTQCEGFFSSDKKLTTEGFDLIKLHHDILQLMTVLYNKYLSIRLINGKVLPNIDPFKDDGSKSLELLSSRSTDNEDDSSWDPEDGECNNTSNNSFEDDNVSNEESQDESECESLYRPAHVTTKPQFDTRYVAVLKSTNGLLCPGDLVAYRQSDPRGKSKLSTIVSLLDPSTQDKKEIILENGDILRPFIHEVKREKMYGGGACEHITDPLLVWMKVEHCTLFVGCTSTFLEVDDDFTNTNDKDDNSYDKCYFWEGKL